MGKPPVRDVKSNIRRGGKHPADLEVERADAKVNSSEPAVDESAQEAPKQDKPKRGKVAALTKQLEEAVKRAEEANKKIEEANKRIKELETLNDEYNKSFFKRNQELAAAEKRNIQLEVDRNVTADSLRTSQNRIKELEDSNKVYIDGAKSLVNRQKALREDYENLKKDKERLSKVNQDYRTQNSILTESIRQSALKSDKEVDQAVKEYGDTSEPKVDNSAKTEETAAPETGEAKVEGEPEVKTEQATQEPNSEAKQTSTESSEMTPEEVYDYLSDKKNFKDAERYFASGKDAYVGTNNKRIPKSWFDVYKGNKDSDHSMFSRNSPNNKDVFTASLRDKGLLEDPNKAPSRAETEITQAETDAKRKFDEWIDSKGNKFRGIFGKHKILYSTLLLAGVSPAIIKGIDAIGDWYVNKAIEENHIPDEEFFNGNSDSENLNNNEPGKVAEDIANAGQETAQAANTAEEQAAQALQENLPQGVTDATNQSKGESPAAANAATPTNTKANNAPASTAESAPTQGLPPVVTRNTPSTNPDSSGMTYSQRVEAAGQAPQAGSMAYNANNPDMVTAGLIDAMNQNSQAGSDAIGYGDLYDQNFIDFWAKRNPNLAFGVSQGRR